MPQQKPDHAAGGMAEPALVWLISADGELTRRIRSLLGPMGEQISVLEMGVMAAEQDWAHRAADPFLIVIDIGRNVDWGVELIQRFKRARIHAPMVILTEDFSKDFAARIISAGVRYYFSRDFCDREFLELTKSLYLATKHTGGKGSAK